MLVRNGAMAWFVCGVTILKTICVYPLEASVPSGKPASPAVQAAAHVGCPENHGMGSWATESGPPRGNLAPPVSIACVRSRPQIHAQLGDWKAPKAAPKAAPGVATPPVALGSKETPTCTDDDWDFSWISMNFQLREFIVRRRICAVLLPRFGGPPWQAAAAWWQEASDGSPHKGISSFDGAYSVEC